MLFPQDKYGMTYKEIAGTLLLKHDLVFCSIDFLTHGKEILSCGNNLLTIGNNLLSCGNDFLSCRNDLLSCGNNLSCGNDLLSHGNNILKKIIGKQFYVPSWAP